MTKYLTVLCMQVSLYVIAAMATVQWPDYNYFILGFAVSVAVSIGRTIGEKDV